MVGAAFRFEPSHLRQYEPMVKFARRKLENSVAVRSGHGDDEIGARGNSMGELPRDEASSIAT